MKPPVPTYQDHTQALILKQVKDYVQQHRLQANDTRGSGSGSRLQNRRNSEVAETCEMPTVELQCDFLTEEHDLFDLNDHIEIVLNREFI